MYLIQGTLTGRPKPCKRFVVVVSQDGKQQGVERLASGIYRETGPTLTADSATTRRRRKRTPAAAKNYSIFARDGETIVQLQSPQGPVELSFTWSEAIQFCAEVLFNTHSPREDHFPPGTAPRDRAS